MKRVLLTCCLCLIVVSTVVGATFVREDVLDDFGDPTGEFQVVTEKKLSGTYKNTSTSNGKCNYSVILTSDSNAVTFVIEENGKDQDLSTAWWTDETYTVKVKDDAGNTISYTGRLQKGPGYNSNAIKIGFEDNGYFWFTSSLRDVMMTNKAIKVVVSNDRGSYSLGTINTSEVSGLYYDKTLYSEAESLYQKGQYEDAKGKLLEMKQSNPKAFKFYNGEELLDIIYKAIYYDKAEALFDEGKYEDAQNILLKMEAEARECYDKNNGEELMDRIYKAIYYDKAVALFDEGKYEEAKEKLQVLEKEMPECYKKNNGDKLKEDIFAALGEYLLGMKGPAGGYIFYDCDADNDTGNVDGLISTECGWRYLEAAPEDIGEYIFGYYKENGEKRQVGTSTDIGAGKSNTEALVKAMGDNAKYAAKKCADYCYGGYDDWFLPSKDELYMMYKNLRKKELGSFAYSDYWSSSESSSNRAWGQYFYSGTQNSNYSRDYDIYVRAVRAF